MKYLKKLIVLAIALYSISLTAATTYSMEAFQCNYVNGKDYSDVQKILPLWHDHADENFSAPYAAVMLQPYLKSEADVEFDLAWIGFSRTQENMGTIADEWLATGSKVQAKWDKVVDCPSYGFYGVYEGRAASADPEEGSQSYWAISSCSFKEGKTGSDLATSDEGWNAFMDNQDHTGGVWRWWPGAGAPNSFEGDFLMNITYSSMAELGRITDARYQASNNGDLPESILNCDNPRVYIAESVRNWGE